MIYLIENNLQLKKLKKIKLDKSDIFIAFTPDIYVELKKQSLIVFPCSDFFYTSDHSKVSKLSYKFTKSIYKYIEVHKFFKTKSAYKTFEFYLKLYLSHCIMLMMIFNRLKEKFKNEEFKSINLKDESISFSVQPILNKGDVFFGKILLDDSRETKLNRECFYCNNFIKIINKFKISKLKNSSYILTGFQNGNMKEYLKLLKEKKEFNSLRIRLSSKNIFLECLYSLYALIKKKDVLTVSSYVNVRLVDSLFHKVMSSFNNIKFNNHIILKVLDQKLYQLIGHCNYLDNSLLSTKEYIEKFNDVRILSLSSLSFESILAESVISINVNSTLISHGSHILHTKEASIEQNYLALGQIDPSCYKEIVVQSPYAYDFIKDKMINIKKSKPIMWGNSFEPIQVANECLDKKQLTVLHASTPKTLFRPLIFETPFEYINNIIEIAKVLKEFPNIKYLVRFRTTDTISLETIKYMLMDYENVNIVTDKTFQYYLNNADIFISYSSTTIEETMLKGKNILLFGNNGIYNHLSVNSEFEKERGIHFVKDKKELANIILNLENNMEKDKYNTYNNEELYLVH